MNVAPQPPLAIDVVSDVVCPWCFVGKRRLERAIANAGVPATIRWHPYQLDPTIPSGGKSRREYLLAKFGSEDRIRQLHRNIESVGAAEGIDFAFERIAVSPNTLDAHRLIRWAGEAEAADAVVEALFRAYFLEGRDIGDRAVLAEIAASCGMERDDVARRLAAEEDLAAVRAAVQAAQQLGVTGVPTFILAGRYGVVGAQPAETLADAINSVATRMAMDPAEPASGPAAAR
jgi:predicted DsbA family dithiol-disulfide isomerase